jgi:hypothetical protein
MSRATEAAATVAIGRAIQIAPSALDLEAGLVGVPALARVVSTTMAPLEAAHHSCAAASASGRPATSHASLPPRYQ